MTDRTFDVEDPRDLPYRFVWSPDTKEVIILSSGRILGFFENRDAFHRFLIEGNKLDNMIQEPIPDTIKDIPGGDAK